jgi:hypothetical protein
METSGRSLADRVDSFPDPWLHEPGDKLVGEVVEVSTADKGYGPYSLLTVLVAERGSTEQGGKAIAPGSERVWHAFGTVPENELKKRSPHVGDLVAVKFFGIREGTDYKAYRILVEQGTPRRDAVGGESTGVEDVTAGETGAAEESVPSVEPGRSVGDDDIPY